MSPSPSALLADHRTAFVGTRNTSALTPRRRYLRPYPGSATLQFGVPEGPVLELACGRSGTALGLTAAGRCVTAIDVSDTALVQLELEATRRNWPIASHWCTPISAPGSRGWTLCSGTLPTILASAHFSPGLRGCGAGRCSGVGGMAAAHRCRSGYPSSRMVLEARPARV